MKLHELQITSLIKNLTSKVYLLKPVVRNKFIEACVIAFLVLVSVFPDIVFNGASFRITDQMMGGNVGEKPRNFYPVFLNTNWSGSYNDNGGALFQSEPMMDFVRNSFKAGESPYWNPYSGTGSLGPEALVDQKFSFFTILYTLSWGGAGAYNSILLSLYFFSLVFLCLIIREQLNLSVYAAIAASIFFLLNGYSTANFGSNIAQNYLYLPMCLYSGIKLIDKISSKRFVGFVLAFTIFYSCTFIPTEITSFCTIYLILIGYLFMKIGKNELDYKQVSGIVGIFLMGTAVALLILSFLYIPIIINIIDGKEIETYAKRIFYPLNFPQAILSLFSPTHLYESYNAMETRALLWEDGKTINGFIGNTVYHMGVVGILLSGCAINFSNNKNKRILLTLILCIILGFLRLFSPYPLDEFFSKIPILGNIGAQYWWPIIVFPMSFLLAFGMDNLINKKANFYIPIGLMAIGLASLFYVYKIYGLQEPNYYFKKISIAILVFTLIFITILIYKQIVEQSNNQTKLIAILILMLFMELIIDSKMIRMARHNDLSNDPAISKYLKENATSSRTLTMGYGGVYPELGSALKINEVTTFNFGVLPDYIKFFRKTFDLGNTQMFYGTSLMMMQDTPELHQIEWKNINLLGIKFIILPAAFIKYDKKLIDHGMEIVYRSPYSIIYSNPNYIPRAFISNAYINNNQNEITLKNGFEKNLKALNITKYENTFVEINGIHDSESIVVLTDSWHKNWKAYVNEKPVEILKVDNIFRGVEVPPGKFTIKMKYEPKWLLFSYGLSCLGFLILLIILLHKNSLIKISRLKKINIV